MKHLGDFGEVDKSSLLGTDFNYLRRPHDKLLFLTNDRVRIFVLDDFVNSLQELFISVITVLLCPSITWATSIFVLLVVILSCFVIIFIDPIFRFLFLLAK